MIFSQAQVPSQARAHLESTVTTNHFLLLIQALAPQVPVQVPQAVQVLQALPLVLHQALTPQALVQVPLAVQVLQALPLVLHQALPQALLQALPQALLQARLQAQDLVLTALLQAARVPTI